MTDLGDDSAGEGEGFGFDGGDDAVKLDEVIALPTFLLALQRQRTILFGNGRCAEIIPTDPLQREPMLAEQFGFRRWVFDGGFSLRMEWDRKRADE